MIQPALAVALLALPCVSQIDHAPQESVAYRCPAPERQGPPRPPFWWGNVRNVDHATVAAVPPAVEPQKPVKRVKRAAHRCGSKTPVWYVKAGKKRYRCR